MQGLGVCIQGSTQNLLSSLEREVLRAEEELQDSLRPMEQDVSASRVRNKMLGREFLKWWLLILCLYRHLRP